MSSLGPTIGIRENVWLNTDTVTHGGQQRKKRRFHFEHAWLREEGCEEVIAHAWEVQQAGTPMF